MIIDERIIAEKMKDVKVTGAFGQSLRTIIEEREERYPILKLCQKCALECKKHGARNLEFKCFEFEEK